MEKEAIQAAYGAAIQAQFKVLNQAVIMANGDAAAEAHAQAAFKSGVALAAKARDLALAALGVA